MTVNPGVAKQGHSSSLWGPSEQESLSQILSCQNIIELFQQWRALTCFHWLSSGFSGKRKKNSSYLASTDWDLWPHPRQISILLNTRLGSLRPSSLDRGHRVLCKWGKKQHERETGAVKFSGWIRGRKKSVPLLKGWIILACIPAHNQSVKGMQSYKQLSQFLFPLLNSWGEQFAAGSAKPLWQ